MLSPETTALSSLSDPGGATAWPAPRPKLLHPTKPIDLIGPAPGGGADQLPDDRRLASKKWGSLQTCSTSHSARA